MELRYSNSAKDLESSQLNGFFVGWPNPPSSETLLKALQNSTYVSIAFTDNQVIGFANCISDNTLTAYIPLLEVLPEYQGNGIGKALIQNLEKQLSHLYMVDICCDNTIAPFYTKLGYTEVSGMIKRNYESLDSL